MKVYRYERLLSLLEQYKNKLDIDVEKGTLSGIGVHLAKNGYYRLTLWNNSKQYNYLLHEVIAVAGGLNPTGLTVNHIDGNKLNNRFENLECITQQANSKHMAVTGLSAKGSRNSQSKFTEKDVLEIRRMYDQGWSQVEIAKNYNVTRQAVYQIVHRKNWTHI